MEPRIQYAKTSDGVNIAFWTLGEGMPFVHMPQPPVTHIGEEWREPDQRRWYERLAEKRMLIRFDTRGFGLSQRNVTDFSVDALVEDVSAVVRYLGLNQVDVYDVSSPATAVAYAATHPEQVSSLIIWSPWLRFEDWPRADVFRSLLEIGTRDWESYTELFFHLAYGFEPGELARKSARRMRASVSAPTWGAYVAALRSQDVMHLLPRVTSPTLAIAATPPAINASSDLAAQLPNARVAIVEGSPLAGYADSVLKTIDEFLGLPVPLPKDQEVAVTNIPSGTAIIFFTDIVDSTALTESLGDAAFRARARELGPALRALVKEHGGTPVEGPTLGDGVLAVFTSAREAIEAAVRCAAAGESSGLPLHVGLHAGDVTREKDPDGRDNVYGGAVNIASRISGLSAAGEVLVSETVRSLARTSAGVRFEDRGEQELKGVGERVRVWAVQEGE